MKNSKTDPAFCCMLPSTCPCLKCKWSLSCSCRFASTCLATAIELFLLKTCIPNYVCLNNQINPNSMDFMVDEYKRMRQRDSSGAAKSAWRITVRQLESMIRLSEAMSRIYCQDEVCPPHPSTRPFLMFCCLQGGK